MFGRASLAQVRTCRRRMSQKHHALSTKAKAKAKTTKVTATTKLTSIDQYYNEKKKSKDYRRELFNSKQERKTKMKTRRDNTKKNYFQNEFRKWFDAMSSKQSYLDREARRSGLPWKIKVAAMVERLPIVTPDVEDWEHAYFNLRAELDRYDTPVYPKELNMPDPLDEKVLTEEELYALLPEGYTPAPRVTEADKNGEIQTLNRQLATRVYLSICSKENNNNNASWTLPTVTLNTTNEETFKAGAKRAVKTVAGDDIVLRCLSNCPMGVYVKSYDSTEEEEGRAYFGEKTFFMRVTYEDGDVDHLSKGSYLSKKVDDWGWLTRDEMVERAVASAASDGDVEEGDDKDGTFYPQFYKYML